MKQVKEIKVGKSIGYLVKDNTDEKERIVCTTSRISKVGDKTVVVFRNSEGVINEDFNKYLNSPAVIAMKPLYLREVCAHLRIFANFLEIYRLSPNDMSDEKIIADFISFLMGGLPISECSARSNASSNKVIITVRGFLKWKKIETPLNIWNSRKSGYEYSLSEKGSKKNDMMYLNKEEIVNLQNVILKSKPCYSTKFLKAKKAIDAKYEKACKSVKRKGGISNLPKPPALPKFDEQGYVIFRLAIFRGLRLGEILGLTLEDIRIIKGSDGSVRKGVYLRNRLSDYDYQYAKELIYPKTHEDYKSREYNKNKVGQVFIDLDKTTWDILQNLICRDIPAFEKAYPEKAEEVKADSVSGVGNNSYIFRNTFGGRLSDQAWNTKFKNYFVNAGLSIDKGKREYNLTHRLRHSFAMILVKDANINPVFLASVLRHKNINTVQAYFTPTEKDIRDIYEAFDKEINGELLPFSMDEQKDVRD